MRPLTITTPTLAVLLTLLSSTLLTATEADARSRWSWELRGAVDPSSLEIAGADVDTGVGFEATVDYRLQPHLSAYLGWGWHHYAADGLLADGGADLEETGYDFGLRFLHPMGDLPFALNLRAGALLRHFEVESSDGDVVEDSGHGWGWEAAAGVAIPVGRDWSLRPGLVYRSLSRDVRVGDAERTVELGGLGVEIGIGRSF